MQTATALIYWLIVGMWFAVLVTLVRAYARDPAAFGVTRLLLIVVGIDTCRNIAENLYFGFYFGSQYGLFSPSIAESLGSPGLLIIPKLLNVLAACVVLGLLLFRWLPLALAERMRAEKAVQVKTGELHREIEERRQIIETALDAFIQIDAQGRILQWSSQAEALFRSPEREAVGERFQDVIGLDDADHQTELQEIVSERRDAARARIQVNAGTRDGNSLSVELSISSSFRESGRVFNIFARDLTAQIAAEAQMRQTQKMEAVGHLTGGIAHDFNNILTVIMGMAEVLSEDLAGDPKRIAYIRMIADAAQRGAEVTRHLLAFSRQQPLQPRETDLNELVEDTAKLLRPSLGEQVEIQLALADDSWSALIDPSHLTTALLNLAFNARDAMGEGGKLTLETGNVYLDEAYAALNVDVRPGHYVMIAVSDTGSGIPEAIRDKVFEPFFTTKGAGKGTGLGLSMVYGFVKQSNGHIKIYSEEGHGTSIKLYLPRATETTKVQEPLAASEAAGRGETILVVEDDSLVRQYASAQLTQLGYRVILTGNGPEALTEIRKGIAFDLLFTDVIMPGGMNGRQLADVARALNPKTRVLFSSGYTEDAIFHHGRLDPGVLLLPKPYRRSDLARMIRLALSQEG